VARSSEPLGRTRESNAEAFHQMSTAPSEHPGVVYRGLL
jgi:hypothetical protein